MASSFWGLLTNLPCQVNLSPPRPAGTIRSFRTGEKLELQVVRQTVARAENPRLNSTPPPD